MKQLLYPTICFLFSAVLQAQVNKAIPAWVAPVDVTQAPEVNRKLVKDGYYYALVDEQYNTVKKQNYFHYALVALTEEALGNVSQIEVEYDPTYQAPCLHLVRIYRNGVAMDRTASVGLKVLNEENQRSQGILEGRKTLYANLSDVRKGDIVEYSYSIMGVNPALKDYFSLTLWLSYSVPVGEIFSRVVIKNGTEPTILNINTAAKPRIRSGEVSDYIWEVKGSAVITEEGSTPEWYDPQQRVQISNLRTWNEVKDHCRTLLAIGPYNNAGLKKIVDSIVRDRSGEEERITAIVEFVQTHIRYSGNENGIYSHVPRSPDYVLKNRYGDCKEKSCLLNEMLRQLNIEAYPVLVNTVLGEKVKERNPSVTTFNHCISVFMYKGEQHFIDPTISYQRGSFRDRIIPSYGTGMVLDNRPGPFETIPDDHKSRTSVREEFRILENGDAMLTAISHYTGLNADDIRYDFLTNSVYDIQNSYRQFYEKYFDKVEVADTVTWNDDEEKNEFTITEQYLLKEFWKSEGRSTTVQKDFMPYSLHGKLNYGEEEKRRDPLKISYPLCYTHTISVYKDGGWNVEDELKEEDNEFFSYAYKTTVKSGVLSLEYKYVAKTAVIAPEKYKDYKKRMDFINRNMVFGAQEVQAGENIYSFNWLLTAALVAGAIAVILLCVILYKRPHVSTYESRYDSIGGWLVLVAIGVTLNPLMLLYGVVRSYADEMGYNYFEYYFKADSPYFSPLQGYFNLFVCFLNVMMFGFSIFIVALLYQKKASFRLYFTVFRLFNVAFLIADVIVLYQLYGQSSNIEHKLVLSKEVSAMVRVIIQAAIWVPYVWYSERSRHTFTRPSQPLEEPASETEIGMEAGPMPLS